MTRSRPTTQGETITLEIPPLTTSDSFHSRGRNGVLRRYPREPLGEFTEGVQTPIRAPLRDGIGYSKVGHDPPQPFHRAEGEAPEPQHAESRDDGPDRKHKQ